jgi:Protein of unknown function (DUF3037)
MKHACRYTIVRFMPYTETGEFANVGIVLMSPSAKFFGYLLIGKVGRITAFFDELDPNIFRQAKKTYAEELMRISEAIQHAFAGLSQGASPDFAGFAFSQLVTPREGLMYADTDRAVLAEDPAEKLRELYDQYVGRAFATKAHQERYVEKRIHGILRAAHLTGLYKEQTLVGGDSYKARMPFVRSDESGQVVRVIKPLYLAHDDPTRLYDHGWEWLGKIKKLRRDSTLSGEVLFAVEKPKDNFGARAAAYASLVQDFTSEQIQVKPEEDDAGIVEFAMR